MKTTLGCSPTSRSTPNASRRPPAEGSLIDHIRSRICRVGSDRLDIVVRPVEIDAGIRGNVQHFRVDDARALDFAGHRGERDRSAYQRAADFEIADLRVERDRVL